MTCEKLQVRSTDIAAFKVAVNEVTYNKMFDPCLWPKNVIIRPYRHRNFSNVPLAQLKK